MRPLPIEKWLPMRPAPIGQPSLCKTFFQDRIKLARGQHIKAFAGETIVATKVLGLFADEVLAPRNRLGEVVGLLNSLREALDLLRLGDAVVSMQSKLDDALASLHENLLSVCPESAKMKPHFDKIWM